MILADLIKIENRLERLAKEGGKATGEIALMRRLAEHLDADRALRALELSEPERQMTSGYQFVSMKPCLALVNQPDDAAAAATTLLSGKYPNYGLTNVRANVEAIYAELRL
jgi:ribosome-binding ATPase YchF (GTP1/OBG family)